MSQSDQQVVNEQKVFKTTDYGQFKTISANRNVSKSHVQFLVESMEAHPELIPTRPILVNENMEVIDGQHRLQAAMVTRQPIYYTIAAGTDVKDAQLMNVLQKNWSVLDFARSYAMDNDQRGLNYREYLQLKEEYPFTHSVLVTFAVGKKSSKAGVAFRKGKFTPMDDKKLIRERLDMLLDTTPYVNFYRDVLFGQAFHRLLLSEEYNHDQMLKKMAQRPINRQVGLANMIRELEDVYNFNNKTGINVRFY